MNEHPAGNTIVEGTGGSEKREDEPGAAISVEARLEEANRFLSAIVAHLPNIVFVKDATTHAFVELNAAGEELLGLSREEVIGRRVEELFPADQASFFLRSDREAFRTRRVVEIPEEPIETARGTRWIATKKVPVPGPDGEPRWLLGISEDITARRQEEELRARLAAIVAHSDDAIVGRDLDGVITSWNRGAERIFGYTSEEVVGSLHSPMLPLDRGGDGPYRVLHDQHGAKQLLTRRRRKDGREIDLSTIVSPIFDSSGRQIGTSAIARDVTESMRAEEALARAKQEAEEANRELESFSYSVAHDLRAPLRSIDGFSQALVEDYDEVLGDDGRRFLGFIRSSAQRMAQLIDDLLALSRVTRADLGWERVDLSALGRASVARLQAAHPNRRVQVAIEDGLEGIGDPRLLAVVLDNLLDNAWKFTARRADPRIEFGAAVEGDERVFFVRDDGAGFDMTFVEKLFGVFQRLHHAADFDGTGVGLATVQRIVRRHGGRIWAQGEVDRGATFFFTLGNQEPV